MVFGTPNKKAFALVIAAFAISKGIKLFKQFRLRQKAQRKLKQKLLKKVNIPEVPYELSELILACTAVEIVEGIRQGKFSCVEVMATYIHRAITIGRDLKLSAEEPFEEALQLAYEHDRKLKQNPESCGSLHGLPISVKDHISQKGCCSSVGLACRCENIDTFDAEILEMLKKQGAIPFIRGNLPQCLLGVESVNRIYGISQNPWKRTHTTGGSSGGDAGIVAARVAPLAIGTDLAGSIRIPSGFCGIYAINPTADRIPGRGIMSPHPEHGDVMYTAPLLKLSAGPMGRTVDDLVLILKSIWQSDTFKQVPMITPLPFNSKVFEDYSTRNNLRIGYFTSNQFIKCSPAIVSALQTAVVDLTERGHHLIQLPVPDLIKSGELVASTIFCNGSDIFTDSLQGEKPIQLYDGLILHDSNIGKLLIDFILGIKREKRLSKSLEFKSHISAKDWWQLYSDIDEYRQQFFNTCKRLELDAVICPIYPFPAVPHNMTDSMSVCLVYTAIWNILGCPSGVVPVGLVLPSQTQYQTELNDFIDSRGKEIMKEAEGLPICIQVASLPWQDEKALGVMKQLEDIYKFHKHPL